MNPQGKVIAASAPAMVTRPSKFSLPPIAIDYIASDLKRASKGHIQPGEVMGLDIAGRHSFVWVWNLEGCPPLTEKESWVDDFTTNAGLKRVGTNSATMPIGVVMILKEQKFIDLEHNRLVELRDWGAFSATLPSSGDVRNANVENGLLTQLVARYWRTNQLVGTFPLLGAGVLAFHQSGKVSSLPILNIVHAKINLLVGIPTAPQLFDVDNYLLYRRATWPHNLPTLDALIKMSEEEAQIQARILLGERPILHLLVVGNPAPSGCPLTLYRNTESAKESIERLRALKDQLGNLAKRKSFTPEKAYSAFQTSVLGRIIETVPITNSKTEEPITHLNL
ncbi:hypothetical protein HY988_07620 [Candidatus Micrarchaeota archaeon]|nr:hypothetical protein [Candidatus Micrarchaeota archaeon]